MTTTGVGSPSGVDGPSFGSRLAAVFAGPGRLCVGIDPHEFLLRDWGLEQGAAGAREFGLRVVDAAAGSVGIVKPQVAFFERFGSAGYAALEEVIRAARAAGLLVIADAKRGDIGTSVDAYGAAWLGAGSPLESDALTVSPYLGVGALESTFRLAEASGKGVFVLAATSNPEADSLQRNGVAARVLDEVRAWNAAHAPSTGSGAEPPSSSGTGPSTGSGTERSTGSGTERSTGSGTERNSDARAATEGSGFGGHLWAEPSAAALASPEESPSRTGPIGSIGVVLGATVDLTAFGIDTAEPDDHPSTPVLAPGFGQQGATVDRVHDIFGGLAGATIVSESRSILVAGPEELDRLVSRRAHDVRKAYA